MIADHFFQAAFGGSFLNHQFLIAAAAPAYSGTGSTHSVLDSNGMPRGITGSGCSGAYPLYSAPSCVVDGNTTQACPGVSGLACGDFAVNTVLPWYQPTSTGFATKIRPIDDTTTPMNIGDLLSDHGVSWAYYGGGWDNAAGNTSGRGWTNGTGPTCSDPNGPAAGAPADGDGNPGGYPFCPNYSYQQHHYPFAYFARYAPGTQDRATHLLDEQDFYWAAAHGALPAVSFVKPVGVDNSIPATRASPTAVTIWSA